MVEFNKQITDVIAYIEAHREEVEAEYQEVLQQAEESRKYWEEQKIRAKLKAWKEKLNTT